MLSVTNWDYPVVIEDTEIGTIAEVFLVTQEDPVWNESIQLAEAVVRLCHLNGKELREVVKIS